MPLGDRQAMRRGRAVDVREQRPALDADSPGLGIDRDAAHRRQIDHHAALAHPGARRVVAAAPDREQKTPVARDRHGNGDALRIDGAGNDGRPPVDVAVPHRPGLVEASIARGHNLTGHASPKLLDGCAS